MYKYFNDSFFPYELQQSYVDAGSWPDGGVDVEDDVFAEYALQQPPNGKTRGTDKKGLPCWVDLPEPTTEELAASAQSKLSTLLAEADAVIVPLERAEKYGIATEDDLSKLKAWSVYQYKLTKVSDQDGYPTNIEWPEKPE